MVPSVPGAKFHGKSWNVRPEKASLRPGSELPFPLTHNPHCHLLAFLGVIHSVSNPSQPHLCTPYPPSPEPRSPTRARALVSSLYNSYNPLMGLWVTLFSRTNEREEKILSFCPIPCTGSGQWEILDIDIWMIPIRLPIHFVIWLSVFDDAV